MNSIKKILLIGSFLPGAIEFQFQFQFQKLGLDVHHYDIQKPYIESLQSSIFNKILYRIAPVIFLKSINKNLLTWIHTQRIEYDAILVFKGMQLFPKTIKNLKKHTKIIANYNLDHPYKIYSRGSANNFVINSIKHFDIYFSYAHSIVEGLKNQFKVQSYHIPFAYDSNLSTSTDIIMTKDVAKNFVFIGAYDDNRNAMLDQINIDNLMIFGDNSWGKRGTKKNRNRFQHRKVYNQEYYSINSLALGSINLLRKQNLEENSHNMRTFEVPGVGGLLISQKTSEQLSFFENGKEAIFFDDFTELNAILNTLSKDEGKGNRIKKLASKRSSTSNYTYYHRAFDMLEIMNRYI